MNWKSVASVELGHAIIFNAGRTIGAKRVISTSFIHCDSLVFDVMDRPVDPQKPGEG